MKETNIRLLQLLADGDWHALREALSRCDLPTLHALIEASPAEAQAILFRLSPHRAAEALFEGFAPAPQAAHGTRGDGRRRRLPARGLHAR